VLVNTKLNSMTIYEVINCSIVSYDISKSNVILTYNYNNFNYVDCLDFSTIYTVSQFTTKYYMIGLHVRSFY